MPPHEAIAAPSWHEPWGLSPAGHQVQTPASCAAPGPHQGGEAPLIHVHAPCQELLRAGLQPQGLRAELAPFPPARPGGLYLGRAKPASPSSGRKGPAPGHRPLLSQPRPVQRPSPQPSGVPASHCVLTGPFPSWGWGWEGSHPLESSLPPSPSTSRPQNGPRGVWAATSPPPPGQGWHEVAASRYCPPGPQKGEACSPLAASAPFSAATPPSLLRPGAEPARSCFGRVRLPPQRGKSTAGTSGKNVPVDMYIPQCWDFVCSNPVNTCMDFIIYI